MPLSLASACSAEPSVFSQAANFAAAAWWAGSVGRAVEEPPQLPVTFSPADHWGSGAMAHLPLVSGAAVVSVPGAHTALTQAICLPVSSALFQAGVYIGWLSMAPSLTRPPQNLATFWVAGSLMATFHLSPEVV